MKNMLITMLILITVMAATSSAAYFSGTEAVARRANLDYWDPYTEAQNIVNGSGLSAPNDWNATHSNSNNDTMWVFDRERGRAGLYPVEGLWVRIRIPDGVGTLRAIKIWNLNSTATSPFPVGLDAGMKDIRITSFDRGSNTWTDLGTYTLNQASGTTSEPGQEINIPDVEHPYYIQITPLSTYGNTKRIGLSEVMFDGDLNEGTASAADQSVTLAAAQAGIALGGSIANGATGATWTKLSGPGTVNFTNAANPATTATFSAAGSYVLALTAAPSGYADHVVIRVGDYDGLIGYWSFDGDAADNSGNGKDGIVHGSPQYVSGKKGQAIAFDGDVDGIELPDEPYFDRVSNVSPGMTVAFWAKMPYGVLPHGHVISKAFYDLTGDIQGSGWSLRCDVNQYGHEILAFLMPRGDIDTRIAIPTTSRYVNLNDGRWHHYALTVDSAGTARTYLDGVYKSSGGTINGTDKSMANNVPISLGYCAGYESGLHWEGQLDEVRIYDRELAAGEIADLVTADGGACSTAIVGDVNGDCKVDMADFAVFAADWFECGKYYTGDCFN